MSEPAYCYNCMKVQPCKVFREVGTWTWECEMCGSVADMDFDDDYLEDFEEVSDEEEVA